MKKKITQLGIQRKPNELHITKLHTYGRCSEFNISQLHMMAQQFVYLFTCAC